MHGVFVFRLPPPCNVQGGDKGLCQEIFEKIHHGQRAARSGICGILQDECGIACAVNYIISSSFSC